MSLAINTNEICAVLMTDGKWYTVKPPSFHCDAYEWGYPIEQGKDAGDFQLEMSNAQDKRSCLGAGWEMPDGGMMYCSVTEIVAVRCMPKEGRNGAMG